MYSYVFAGQGSQRPGMGEDFYQEFEEAKKVFEISSEALGEDITTICFQENPKLDLTEYTQPAILTMEMAIYEVLKTFKKTGTYFAGHSLGEYTALTAAEVFSIKDAVKIVHKRGELMQKAVPEGVGSMAALISEDIEQYPYQDILTECEVDLANINSKDQVVISGKKENVEKAVKIIQEKFSSIEAIFLNVSAPFHSKLMQEIEKEFKEFLSQFSLKKEKCIHVLSNFTGTFHTPENLIENLVRQISGSVRWIENMKVLIQKRIPIIEIGPNRPLGKFFLTLGEKVPSIINIRSFYKVFPELKSR